jgi:hypothetical protein
VQSTPLIATPRKVRDYQSLRFVASLIVFLGVVVIVCSIAASLYCYVNYVDMGGAITQQGGSDVPLYDPNQYAFIDPSTYLLASLLIGLFGTLGGVFTIAYGQLIMLFIDIRDDVRSLVPPTPQ